MTNPIPTLALAVLLSAGLAADPSPVPQEPDTGLPAPEFPAGVDVVTVDVVVLDRHGNPIEGLTEDDFTVVDEGTRRPITSFEAVTLPESEPGPPPMRSRVSTNVEPAARPERTFAIVFDNVHMDQATAVVAKRSVEEFMETGLGEGDRVVLVPTSGGAWWTARIPDGRQDLVAALGRLDGERPRNRGVDRISDYEAMRLYLHRDQQIGAQVVRRYYEYRVIPETPGHADRVEAGLTDIGEGHPLIRIKSAEVYQAARVRRQATFDALERVAESLATAKGRKSILLVSEGFVQEPNLPEFKSAVKAAREANAVIYFLDARGLTTFLDTADAAMADPTDLRDLSAQLNLPLLDSLGAQSLAVDTGGFAIRNQNDLAVGMGRIDRQSRSYYLMGFSIADVKRDGKFRKLEVKVNHPDAKVVARNGYYAPSDEPPKPLPEDTLDPAIRTAIDSPFESEGIRPEDELLRAGDRRRGGERPAHRRRGSAERGVRQRGGEARGSPLHGPPGELSRHRGDVAPRAAGGPEPAPGHLPADPGSAGSPSSATSSSRPGPTRRASSSGTSTATVSAPSGTSSTCRPSTGCVSPPRS